jgi:hypothetical protein
LSEYQIFYLIYKISLRGIKKEDIQENKRVLLKKLIISVTILSLKILEGGKTDNGNGDSFPWWEES